MSRALSSLALLMLLAACHGAASRRPPRADLGPALLIPASPHPITPADQCGAKALAYLVGKPRTAIPVAVEPSTRRVSCSTCPMADDYRPDRTTILFDAQTGLITAVSCG